MSNFRALRSLVCSDKLNIHGYTLWIDWLATRVSNEITGHPSERSKSVQRIVVPDALLVLFESRLGNVIWNVRVNDLPFPIRLIRLFDLKPLLAQESINAELSLNERISQHCVQVYVETVDLDAMGGNLSSDPAAMVPTISNPIFAAGVQLIDFGCL